MTRFAVIAHGNKRGAIGLRGRVTCNVEADSHDAALLAAYDHIEHLSNVRIYAIDEHGMAEATPHRYLTVNMEGL